MLLKILMWILRLFAWPWAVRRLERWPAAPRMTAGRQRNTGAPESTAEGWTLYGLYGQTSWEARFGGPLLEKKMDETLRKIKDEIVELESMRSRSTHLSLRLAQLKDTVKLAEKYLCNQLQEQP